MKKPDDSLPYFAVFGNPISHSLSPVIHQAFAKQLGKDLRYEKIEVPIGKFHETLTEFKAAGGCGANVTLPFKQEAYKLCVQLSDAASHAHAVNTIGFDGDVLWGDNTDGMGLLNDLNRNKGIHLEGKRVLVLGAGGAAHGILPVLLKQNVSKIILVNRTLAKAQALAAHDPRIEAYDFGSVPTMVTPVDIVINATSASLQNAVPDISPNWLNNTMAIDLAYLRQRQETCFMEWAKEHGAKQVWDGIGMLVEQAAISFQRWHGVVPETKSIIEKLNRRDFSID